MIQTFSYTVSDVRPYISWGYFFHAWQVSMKGSHTSVTSRRQDTVKESEAKVAESLYADAENWLNNAQGEFTIQAQLGLFDANSDGDDIIVHAGEEMRLPMLRQQHKADSAMPNYCLADFIRPDNKENNHDRIGVFAATAAPHNIITTEADPYSALMQQTLCDRLAEAAIEKLHANVRRTIWGYASEEDLTVQDILAGRYQGIRPAVGYPSMPDQSINFLLDKLIDFKKINVTLTENGAMHPHSSVSGLIIAHPQARYFSIGTIGKDQLEDYARRRRMTLVQMEHFLAANL